ncbi:MAG: hypothetical protein ALECFALPRED_000202 [Alectoria fallacina]|uniref:Uncharacterized protein n=1 Tax=Alectoria fallacina TaxID=1903189 RepID=A0A8H3HWG5_9LECA|nr:MAG: hypothetical protein ALECFALPRED_000202 [Alectoria fallacina]
MWYSFGGVHSAAIDFQSGTFIAEVALIQEERAALQMMNLIGHYDTKEKQTELKPITASMSTPWRLFWWIQFAIILWICGRPNDNTNKVPGSEKMESLSPDQSRRLVPDRINANRFRLHQLPLLQRVLTTEPIQYLGSIWFALCLLHGPLMEGFGWHIIRPIRNVVGGQDKTGV